MTISALTWTLTCYSQITIPHAELLTMLLNVSNYAGRSHKTDSACIPYFVNLTMIYYWWYGAVPRKPLRLAMFMYIGGTWIKVAYLLSHIHVTRRFIVHISVVLPIMNILNVVSVQCSGKCDWTWRRHDMQTLSALLGLCEGKQQYTGGFPSQRASDAELWCF